MEIPAKPIKRVNLFNQAIMFFTNGGWIGLKAPKDANYHFHAGFTPEGLSLLKTVENPKSRTPLAKVSNEELQAGLGSFLSEILRNEIDPTDQEFRKWTVLIPRSTSPDSPIARKLIVEKGREATVTLEPLILLGPRGALHELFYVLPTADVVGRQFKWALAYPTRNWREFSRRTMRWLHGWYGRYYVISDRKRNMLLRQSFGFSRASPHRS